MPLTSEQKKLIRNHLPTVVRHIGLFMTIMDLKNDEIDEGIKQTMLTELIDKMEENLEEVKQVIQSL